MRRLQNAGVGILYVSHRLEEVFAVANRFSVLRNGHLVGAGEIAQTTVEAVINMMVGQPISAFLPRRASAPGQVVLRTEGLTGRRIRDITLDVRAGEIVGIAGLAGSGRSEILRILGGARRAHAGRMFLGEREFRPRSPGDAHRSGVALVPQERRSEGLIPESVERNLNATTIDAHASAGRFLVSRRRERDHALRLWEAFQIRARGLDQPVFELSGGNQQKVVLAKTAALKPRVLLLDEPTRGVDIPTKRQIYGLIRERAESGCAIVMVGSELVELQRLCDRIVVLHEGRVVRTFDARAVSEAQLLHACYGRSL
ncbi:MAG: hypothetical protein C4321_02000 [Chloroflexota bacterium]